MHPISGKRGPYGVKHFKTIILPQLFSTNEIFAVIVVVGKARILGNSTCTTGRAVQVPSGHKVAC